MLATHAFPYSLHSSPTPTTRHYPLLSCRPALADSTNINSHSNGSSPYIKSCVYPTSSTRTSCSWNDVESSTGSVSTLVHSRHHHFSSTSSPFPVTSKAPPTVSISLSAACSQIITGEPHRALRVQGSEPDLPDVRSVVPFPSTPLDADTDVDMLDGTSSSDGHYPSAGRTPRKRHSAHSSRSSSQSTLGKGVKPKRAKKSKRQVAELWWLGVVHRSIQCGIEVRQSVGTLDVSDRSLSGPCELDAMDRVLVEKIQRRLVDNGCVEGRALPNPLPRISSPTISVPSLNLITPSRKTLPTGLGPFPSVSELNPTGSSVFGGAPTSQAPSCTSVSIALNSHSHPPTPPSTPTSHRRNVRFEIPQRPRQPSLLHPSIPRRSPSPPPRTGTMSTNASTLTLTMPQLVASLTLAYHERSGLRLRGRTDKVTECGKNAGRSLLSVPSKGMQCSDADATYQHLLTTRARLSSAPERKSPLSRVVYAES